MKAIRVHETGGAEKLALEDVPVPTPGPCQARIKLVAIGVNFIDIYFRSGLYKTTLPFTPGMEASGTVDALGPGVSSIAVGDRVAYTLNLGTYSEYAVADAKLLVKLPAQIDFQTAAAALLQGMTAHYLVYSTFPLQRGHTALVHSAAGGVGLLLTQVAKMTGAEVIGTVSSEEKETLARQAGADHVVRYDHVDFETEVKRITAGRGVEVVYDSVGRTTFEKGLNCLKRRGMMVLFGQSSGPVAPFDLNILNVKGSIYVTRPTLGHYVATPEELSWRSGELFTWITERRLNVHIDRTFPLREAADAQRALEGRKTKGKVLLAP